MIQNDDLSYSVYESSEIFLDSSFNLIFSTKNTLSKTLFIEASNPTALSNAYLPVYLTVQSSAPFFIDDPPSIVQMIAGETLSYEIPPYSDNEDLEVSLSIIGLDDTVMKYDEATRTIKLNTDIAGNHTINLQLKNSQEAVTSYSVTFEISERPVKDNFEQAQINFEYNWEPKSNQEPEDEEICQAFVYELSSLGDLKVGFSTLMQTDLINLGWLNQSVIDLYIIPANER